MRLRCLLATVILVSGAFGANAQDIQLRPIEIPNDISHWPRSGFVEMVPIVQLPTNRRGDNMVRVWLRVPDGGTIGVRWLEEQQRHVPVFPPGTVADRVETMKNEPKAMLVINGIEDVRGATIDQDGRTRFHVYEPVPGGPAGVLRGYEWLRIDNQSDNRAADSLISLFYPNAPDSAQAEMRLFRRLNQCGACHQPNRPTPTTSSLMLASPSHLPTDAYGFFQPLAVLESSMNVRASRPWDLNADDPFVSVWCGDERIHAVTDGDRRGYKCSGGQPAIGRLDMVAALAKKDAHALAVCASRKYLYQHMNTQARDAYRRSFTECSIK